MFAAFVGIRGNCSSADVAYVTADAVVEVIFTGCQNTWKGKQRINFKILIPSILIVRKGFGKTK